MKKYVAMLLSALMMIASGRCAAPQPALAVLPRAFRYGRDAGAAALG